MDQGKPSSSSLNPRYPPSRRTRSASTSDLIQNHAGRERIDGSGAGAQDAALLADFGMPVSSSQGYYPSMAPLPGFYGNFVQHDNMIPSQSPSGSPTPINYHWHTATAPPHSNSSTNQHSVPQASSMNSHPLSFLNSPLSSLHPSDAMSQAQQAQTSAAASNSISSSPEVDLTETDPAAASDEKRRRNTAASARFRVKKKHRTIALERAVSDLTGQAEELEREVGDLRRENGWLKEIVVLKGTQNVANNRLALRQAVAFATGQRSNHDGTESTIQEDVLEGSSSAPSDDDIPVKRSKGKQRSNKKS